eukprot:c4982_g1_i1.p1 GENE.c4982_g1_i1~~c4982_g1_i1.p1  ORF type:complete len:466 (+),score=111.62 c4982_g1_i1:33-1400(+)
MTTTTSFCFALLWCGLFACIHCVANSSPKLPFPPIRSTLGKGFMLNIPEEMLKHLEEDGKRMEKFDQRSHKHGKRTTFQFALRKGQEPRFSVEEFALKVIAPIDFPKGIPNYVVAFEYWVQRRSHTEEIGFHYDKDEAHASTKQRMVFPYMGTVTYLSHIGAPTLVLNQTTDQFGNSEVPVIPTNGILSYPVKGKHIWFHGKAQHGVHAKMNQSGKGERFTLLVNWWSKVPEPPNCIYLSDEDLSRLGLKPFPPSILAQWSPDSATQIEPSEIQTPNLAEAHNFTIVLPPNDQLTLRLPHLDLTANSLWTFSLPRTHVGFLGELDPNKATQRAHIQYSSNLFAFVFVDNTESRISMTQILHPIQWDLYHGGQVLEGIEIYIADAALCRNAMQSFGVNYTPGSGRQLPDIVVVDVTKKKHWMIPQNSNIPTEDSIRAFFAERLAARGKKMPLKSEL